MKLIIMQMQFGKLGNCFIFMNWNSLFIIFMKIILYVRIFCEIPCILFKLSGLYVLKSQTQVLGILYNDYKSQIFSSTQD